MKEDKTSSVQDLLSVDLDSIVEKGKEKEQKKRKRTVLTSVIVGILCLTAIVTLVYIRVIVPSNQYNDSATLLERGEYQEAIDGFEALGDFKDSADMISESKYRWAEDLLADKSYDEAYAKFKEIQDYSDAADRMKGVRYAEAEDCLADNGFWKAIELFENLGDYRDAQDRVKESNYLWAENYLAQGQLEGALMYFKKAGDYKDATSRATEVYEMMQIHATAVKLSKTSLTIDKGKTAELTATLEPSDTTDTIVSWTSSDEKVATVDGNGVVKAVGYGTATIEVKTSNGLSSMCKVSVPKSETPTREKTEASTSTNSNNDVSYGTSKKVPASAVPLTSEALQGTWKSNVYDGREIEYEYFLRFSGNTFSLKHYCYISQETKNHSDIVKYIDSGTYYIDGPNIVVTYQTQSVWEGTVSGWKTKTWPVEYIHPGGIRFADGLMGVKSYYKMDAIYDSL